MINADYIRYDLGKVMVLLRMGIMGTLVNPDEMSDANVVMRVAHQLLEALDKNIINQAHITGTDTQANSQVSRVK